MAEEKTVNDLVNEAAKPKAPEGGDSPEKKEEVKVPEKIPETGVDQKDKVPEEKTAAGAEDKNQDPPKEIPPVPDALGELLKELGLSDVSELKTKLTQNSAKVLSPEEKEKEQEKYNAGLQQYAVENNHMKLEDFSKLTALKQTPDRDIIFKEFARDVAEEVKLDNPEATPEQLAAVIAEEFEKEYPLNSANAKTKARAEAKIKREADQMRAPLEKSFAEVKEDFDEALSIKSAFPVFIERMEAIAGEVTPEKFQVLTEKDGDEDVNIEIPLTAEQKKEISKAVLKELSDKPAFELFKNKDFAKIKELAQKKVNAMVREMNYEAGVKKVFEVAMGRGTKKGSTTGAKQPFVEGQDNAAGKDKAPAKTEKEKVLDSLKGKK